MRGHSAYVTVGSHEIGSNRATRASDTIRTSCIRRADLHGFVSPSPCLALAVPCPGNTPTLDKSPRHSHFRSGNEKEGQNAHDIGFCTTSVMSLRSRAKEQRRTPSPTEHDYRAPLRVSNERAGTSP